MPKKIIESECLGCGACEETCLVGCISSTEDSIRVVDSSACVDCCACTLVCPVSCIRDM